MEKLVLSVEAINKKFGIQPVIENLSLEMHKGERIAIFAPSGAGKTTLIKILAGLEPFDSGRVKGLDTAPAVLFQEPRLFAYLTVEENIFLPFKLHQKKITPEIRLEYRRWLEVCGLMAFANYYPHQLSGGMKQKTALIRGLLAKPGLVLMDEPFLSIDAASKKRIIDHILSIGQDMSMLFVTHIAAEIPLLAHQALVFKSDHLVNPVKVQAQHFTQPPVGQLAPNSQSSILEIYDGIRLTL